MLQRSHEMLTEAQMPCDDQARHVDVLCFTNSDTDRAVLPVCHHADESVPDRALQPVALEADEENEVEDVNSNSSEEDNILNDSEACEHPHTEHLETDSAVQPAESHGIDIDTDSAMQPGEFPPIADVNNHVAQQASDALHDSANDETFEEDLHITALESTTSAHDDWLHRGPFLFDMDFHTYMRFTVRKPRPRHLKVSEVDQAEHCFLFDSHYALAASHWQQLVTDGHAKLIVMEALRCPLPSLNNGEDNAVFKSLIGTLIKCPGPGHCADPLCCRGGFFQVTVPVSSTQTPTSDLPDWIHHANFTPSRCPLRISRTTHADNVPSAFSCRMQWKARRAEIEMLAGQATDLSHDAKRIPVLADTTLLRAFHKAKAAQRAAPLPLTWRFLVCFTQLWMQKTRQAFPPFAPKVLEYIGSAIHHPHQMSLAQFCAYHLRDVIYNLDMLAIARSTKLTATSKEKVEDEAVEHVDTSGSLLETEFHGGEQADEPDDDDDAKGSWRFECKLSPEKLKAILARHSEVASASKKAERAQP